MILDFENTVYRLVPSVIISSNTLNYYHHSHNHSTNYHVY